MILGNQLLQGNCDQRGKGPLFETHHGSCSSSSLIASPCPSFVNLSFSSFPVRILLFFFYCSHSAVCLIVLAKIESEAQREEQTREDDGIGHLTRMHCPSSALTGQGRG